jgi:glutamyl-tRNA(Gln) amidotransferase subunit D
MAVKTAQPKAGDMVRVTTEEETLEGMLLPRPEVLDKNIVVVKLDNGYNIGIAKTRIKKTEVIKPYAAPSTKKKTIKQNPKLPTVALISFGGTISSRVDYRTGGVYADYDASDFLAMCPELADIANIKAVKAASVMSEDMDCSDWVSMAKAIAKELKSEKIAGVVATLGTDTLHYAAAAVSFMLGRINKPVIFTAAQRSIDRGSSDAFLNLVCSAIAASQFDGAVVATCMHATSDDTSCLLVRGTKVRKMHTSRRDAFRPVNEKALAEVFPDGKVTILNDRYPKRDPEQKLALQTAFEDKTALIQVYPGIKPDHIEYYIKKGYRGLVISATALGHVPTYHKTNSLIDVLKRAIDKGIVVVIASQTLYGRTHPYVYTNLRKLSLEAQCVFAEDMMPEVAYVKLGWVLGQEKDAAKAKKLFLRDLTGEINQRIAIDEFLN